MILVTLHRLTILLLTLINFATYLMALSEQSDCVKNLIRNLFGDDQTILLIYDEDLTTDHVRLDIKNVVFRWNVNAKVIVTTKNVPFNNVNYVLYVSDIGRIYDTFRNVIDNVIYWNQSVSHYGIFVIIFNGTLSFINEHETIGYFKENYILKVIFVDLNDCTMLTIDPYKNVFITHDIANNNNNNSLRYSQLFRFLYDMQNIIANIQILPTFYQPPYMDTSTDPPCGLLLNPFHLFASKYNVRLNFDITSDNLSNRNKSTEALQHWYQAVNNGTMDVNAIHPMQFGFRSNSTLTKIFMSQSYVWLITKPKRLSHTNVLALTFNKHVWLTIIVTETFSFIVLYLIDKLIDKTNTNIDSIALNIIRMILCNGTVHNVRRNNVQRISLITFVLYSYIVNYIFQCKYSSYVTVPLYEDRIDTDEKLAMKTDLIPMVHNIFKYHVSTWNASYSNLLKERVVYRIASLNYIEFIKRYPNMVVMAFPMLNTITSGQMEFIIDIFENNVIPTFQPRYILKYGSTFTEALNNITQIVLESGLVFKWQIDLRKVEFARDVPNRYVSLNLRQVNCSFIILAIGLILATIIFVLEFAINYKKKFSFLNNDYYANFNH